MSDEVLRDGLRRKADNMKESANRAPDAATVMNIACKFCGKDGFSWQQVDGRWRLKDSNGNLHECRKRGWPVPTQAPSEQYVPETFPGVKNSRAYQGRMITLLMAIPATWSVEFKKKAEGGWQARVQTEDVFDGNDTEWQDGILPADALFKALSAVPSEENQDPEGEACPEASGYPKSTE